MPRRPAQKWTSIARPITQAAFVIFILAASIRHHTAAISTASTHAYCPFGVIASIWPLITTGQFAPKIHMSSAVLGAGVLISALAVGSSFCGWVCPLGALGDGLAWLRRKLRIRALAVPARLDRILRYGRYIMLVGIIYATASTAKLWFGDYDPYYTLFSLDFLFEFNWAEYWRAYIVAAAIIGGSLVIPRLWCRYLCPLGGLLNLVQRLSPLKIRRSAPICINCKRCDRVCPMGLDVSPAGTVKSDCVMCLRCVDVCPAPGALEVALPGYDKPKVEEERAA
ncbi:MAG: 4Fe-4S binding protein [Anaerolineae bacterium]|nr:4Fe-4S binding protein [Anaerolineae bacterium]